MGRMKENPRYNVLSVRVTDAELRQVNEIIGTRTRQDFLHGALLFAMKEWGDWEKGESHVG